MLSIPKKNRPYALPNLVLYFSGFAHFNNVSLSWSFLPFPKRLTHSFFGWLVILWANIILYGMGCFPEIKWEQRLKKGESYMLVSNHTSMLDIMLMLKVSKNPFVFIGKKELVNIPLFGFFYKRVCILVDRESAKSRTAVYRRAQKRLQQGLEYMYFSRRRGAR